MFRGLSAAEDELRARGGSTFSGARLAAERERLGLPAYPYLPSRMAERRGHYPRSGAPVRIRLQRERHDYYRELEQRDGDGSGCALCRPVASEIACRLDSVAGALQRNRHPYGLHHGLFKSTLLTEGQHQRRDDWHSAAPLGALLTLALGLGAEGRSEYEVWQSGFFGTQPHFHLQFRRGRASIWEYEPLARRSHPSPAGPILLERYPSSPLYLESGSRALLERTLAGLSLAPDGIRGTGILSCHEEGRWKLLVVRGKKFFRFGHPIGILERLGEWTVTMEPELACDLGELEESLRKASVAPNIDYPGNPGPPSPPPS